MTGMKKPTLKAMVWPFLLVIVTQLMLATFSVYALSAIRGSIMGEGLWTKAQHNAVYFLGLYVMSGNEADFQRYLKAQDILLAVRHTQQTVQSPHIDKEVARTGLLKVGCKEADIPGMLWIFSNFQGLDFIDKAFDAATAIDTPFLQLDGLAEEIHRQVKGTVSDNQRRSLLKKVEAIGALASPHQTSFSEALGEAGRRLEHSLIVANLMLAIALVTLTIWRVQRFLKHRKAIEASLHDAHNRSQDLRTQLAHVWSMNSLGEMAAILAHELNQPLSAIANYLQGSRAILIHEKDQNDDLLEAVDQAGIQALRAGEIIRRMRSLIAQKDCNHREESLQDLISEIDFMIRLVAREANVTVRYDFSVQSDVVYVDRIQIQQVVSNLARNACEAMHGQPERILEISTRSDGRSWTVSIDDSGPGIAPDMVDKLFVPLATSKEHGMGLGLTVSRAIIRHHDGELWVATSRRGGSSFGFTIPIHSKN